MKMKVLMVVLAAVSVNGLAFAAKTNQVGQVKVPRVMRLYGGKVALPNSQKGTIAIFNCQKKVSAAEFMPSVQAFTKSYRYNVVVKNASDPVSVQTAAEIMKSARVQVAVFLTEDAVVRQRLLVAPEEHWAIVNVKSVVDGAKNRIFEVSRTRKELLRALLCAAGAMNSSYPGSMMYPVSTAREIDTLVDEPPIDAVIRTVEALKKIGVTPAEYVTYEDACKEGWAPQPTNEYQKAVWEKVHKAPTKPIVIKPEPAKAK